MGTVGMGDTGDLPALHHQHLQQQQQPQQPDLIQRAPPIDREADKSLEPIANGSSSRKLDKLKTEAKLPLPQHLPIEHSRPRCTLGFCRSNEGFNICGHCLYLLLFAGSLVFICVLMYYLVSISMEGGGLK